MGTDLHILAIYGSPRKGGNTDTLLEAFVSGAQAAGALIQRVIARDLNVRACSECRQCEKLGRCVVDDDMQKVYPLLSEAPAVVLASPIFFYTVTGCVKPIIDRAQALWVRKYLLRDGPPTTIDGIERLGYFLSCGATRGRKLFEGALLTMKYFFDAAGVRLAQSLTYRRVEKMGDIQKEAGALEEAGALGRTAALRILRTGPSGKGAQGRLDRGDAEKAQRSTEKNIHGNR